MDGADEEEDKIGERRQIYKNYRRDVYRKRKNEAELYNKKASTKE